MLTKTKKAVSKYSQRLSLCLRLVTSSLLFWSAFFFIHYGCTKINTSEYFVALFAIFGGFILCGAATAHLIFSVLLLLIELNWDAKNYARLDLIISRSINLLSNSIFVGKAEIAALKVYLGAMRLQKGDFENAATIFSQAITALRQSAANAQPDQRKMFDPSIAVALNYLAIALLRQNNIQDSESKVKESLEVLESSGQRNLEFYTAFPVATCGLIHLSKDELTLAEQMFLRSKVICETAKSPASASESTIRKLKATLYLGLAQVYVRTGKVDESLYYFHQMSEVVEQNLLHMNTGNLSILYALSNEYMNAGLLIEAEDAVAIAYRVASNNPFHPHSARCLDYFEKLLRLTGRDKEIADMRSWLRPL